MLERHQRGAACLPLLELLQPVGAFPASVRRKRELKREHLNCYKALGHLLNDLEGVVGATRMPGLDPPVRMRRWHETAPATCGPSAD